MHRNKAILRRLKSDPSLGQYNEEVLKSIYILPPWMVVISSLRWLFVISALVSLRLPLWGNLIVATICVLMDYSIPGLFEKCLLLLQLIALVLAVFHRGIFSWFSLSFLLYLAWYIGSFIVSARWFRERTYILNAYAERESDKERLKR